MHKLTKLIIDNESNQRVHHDKIITQFLESAAKEIGQNDSPTGLSTRALLGLERFEPKDDLTVAKEKIMAGQGQNDPVPEECPEPFKSEESQKWCSHCKSSESILGNKGYFWQGQRIEYDWGWRFCPICGIQSPKKIEEKGLQERFEDYLIRPRTRDPKITAEDLLDMARIHFTQNPKRAT